MILLLDYRAIVLKAMDITKQLSTFLSVGFPAGLSVCQIRLPLASRISLFELGEQKISIT